MTRPDVRALGYHRLATCLRPPDLEVLRYNLLSSALSPAPGPVLAVLAPHVDGALAEAWRDLFEEPGEIALETTWLGEDDRRWRSLETLYELTEVELPVTDPPDHVSSELELAGRLCALEATEATLPPEQRRWRAVRRALMEQHLGRWTGPLCDHVETQPRHPFYRELAGILRRWVRADLAEQRWEAAPLPADAGPPRPDPRSLHAGSSLWSSF